MTTITKRVLLVGGLLAAAIVIAGLIPISLSDTFISRHGDAMDWWSAWLAGRHGVNCGRVRMGQDPAPATRCGIEAFVTGRPFHVRYDITGMDSPVAVALVRTANGRMRALSFVGDASGGKGTSFWGQRVDVQACPEPARLYLYRLGTVMNCFPAELSYSPDHSRLDRIIQDLLDLLRE
jgi:hypothetical protein